MICHILKVAIGLIYYMTINDVFYMFAPDIDYTSNLIYHFLFLFRLKLCKELLRIICIVKKEDFMHIYFIFVHMYIYIYVCMYVYFYMCVHMFM